MKQFTIISGLAVIILIVALTLLSVESKMDRQDELDRAVSAAVRQTVKSSQAENQTDITSNKEMVAHFIHLLTTGIESDGKLSVKVIGVDYRRGMLDVNVTEEFTYLTGKKATIKIRKCAIYG